MRGQQYAGAPGEKKRRRFDDAEMQFVARQEVVAPCALPVSTSRYLRRLGSIVLLRDDKLPVVRRDNSSYLREERTRRRKRERETTEMRAKKCVTNLSAIDIDRPPLKVKSRLLMFWRETCVNGGHYLIDVAVYNFKHTLHVSYIN